MLCTRANRQRKMKTMLSKSAGEASKRFGTSNFTVVTMSHDDYDTKSSLFELRLLWEVFHDFRHLLKSTQRVCKTPVVCKETRTTQNCTTTRTCQSTTKNYITSTKLARHYDRNLLRFSFCLDEHGRRNPYLPTVLPSARHLSHHFCGNFSQENQRCSGLKRLLLVFVICCKPETIATYQQ